jgi:mono/diheme cytochrome c family protein
MTISSANIRKPSSIAAWLCSLLLAGAVGCGAPEAQFKVNRTYTLNQELSSGSKLGERTQDVADVIAALFGTPDQPHVPALADVDTATVLDAGRLTMAAGPVGSDERGNPRGLYREHCAHCHGVTGDGMGPTAAFLNPYPRDYRKGQYKFKSTPVGSRPTHEDLRKIVLEGIPGTAMPSFKLLAADEVDALVHYVKYLSIRGEVERALISTTLSELEEKDRLIDLELQRSTDAAKKEAFAGQLDIIKAAATDSFSAWSGAEENITPIANKPEMTLTQEQSIARGREVFYTVANCNKCHGDSALGDGQTTDYDEWTKELSPDKPELLDKYLAVGALEPRNIRPRNLRQGIYRGGRRPIDIYWRVINGIEGTPMPGLGPNVLKPGDPPDPKKLTQEDVWHLIEYVRSMPYEPISQGTEHLPNVQRDRN